MATVVVLDCDWFVINGHRYLKQLAYFVPRTSKSDFFTFSLPSQSHCCRSELTKQAYHSHGLLWSQRGNFRDDQVPLAFCTIFKALLLRPVDLKFYAKGLEKSRLLEQWVPVVCNLDEIGCPRFELLSELSKTTDNKARVFGTWLAKQSELLTLLQQPI